jgi:hypothetical protein
MHLERGEVLPVLCVDVLGRRRREVGDESGSESEDTVSRPIFLRVKYEAHRLDLVDSTFNMSNLTVVSIRVLLRCEHCQSWHVILRPAKLDPLMQRLIWSENKA